MKRLWNGKCLACLHNFDFTGLLIWQRCSSRGHALARASSDHISISHLLYLRNCAVLLHWTDDNLAEINCPFEQKTLLDIAIRRHGNGGQPRWDLRPGHKRSPSERWKYEISFLDSVTQIKCITAALIKKWWKLVFGVWREKQESKPKKKWRLLAYLLNLSHFRELSAELPKPYSEFYRPVLHSEKKNGTIC